MRLAAGRGRIDLLGHSFGGLLSLHYALEFPGRVGKLVLVDPDPASRDLWETFEERLTARTMPPDAAHFPFVEDPDAFAAAVVGFLEGR